MLLMIFSVSFSKNSEYIKKKNNVKENPEEFAVCASVLKKTSSYKPHLNGSLLVFSIQKLIYLTSFLNVQTLLPMKV